MGVLAQNRRLRGLQFYVVEKEGAHSWKGFEDMGLYTRGPGGQPTLIEPMTQGQRS